MEVSLSLPIASLSPLTLGSWFQNKNEINDLFGSWFPHFSTLVFKVLCFAIFNVLFRFEK